MKLKKREKKKKKEGSTKEKGDKLPKHKFLIRHYTPLINFGTLHL